jgi:outer membrane protein assembly factor BamB
VTCSSLSRSGITDGSGVLVTVSHRVRAALAGGAVCALLASCSAGTANVGAGNANAGSGSGSGAPGLTVLTHGASSGDIFLAAQSPGATGPEIVSTSGKVIWFHPLPPGSDATDFRAQTYLGKPVLTWFQMVNGVGEGVIDNDRYQQIATVKPANGYAADFHEFLITPWNTALILADTPGTANLTSLGLSAHQQVNDGVVQEIDIKTGKLLFQWDSADHVPYSDSHAPMGQPGQPWDWFHINAVHLDTDGNLLISSRFTWTIYKVNIRTGAIMWELGGKQSSFTLRAAPGLVLDKAGEIFAFQHDPEALGGGEYSVFDDESDGPTTPLAHSRAVIMRLDLATCTATLIWSANQPEGLVADATGSAQPLRNGDMFVSWGGLGYMSEFSRTGKLLFNAELRGGGATYRAYLLPWPPAAATP